MRIVAGVWWVLCVVGHALYACRAPVMALVIGGGLIAFTDQARDMVLASVAPDASVGSRVSFCVFVLLWAAMSWFWSRAALQAGFVERNRPPSALSGNRRRWVAWLFGRPWVVFVASQVPRLIGVLSIGAVALAFQSGYAAYRDAGATEAAGIYRNYAWAVGGLALVFYLVLVLRKEMSARLDRRIAQDGKNWRHVRSAFSGVEKTILVASLIASPAFFLWFAADPVGAAAFFGNSVNVVLFGLAILTPALAFLALLSQRLGVPLFGIALILTAVVPGLTHDHHDVRLCEPSGDKARCADPGYPTATRLDLRSVFVKWWDYNAKPEMFAPLAEDFPADWRTPPLVIVSTAGGASRAAFWTSLVLGELAAREDHFADRLFLVSGVSGGSLGATLFRSLVEEDRLRHPPDGSPRLPTAPSDAERFMRHDFLGPALGAGLYVDLPVGAVSFFTGLGRPPDRAAALEKAWEDAWLASAGGGASRPFSWDDGFLKVFHTGERVWPVLALNGTSVSKGKRTITSNAEFEVSDRKDPSKLDPVPTMSQSEGRYETFRLLNADIPISTAVTMSARFPVISPTGGLRDRKGTLQGRITDGGLFENFGAMTADEVLRYLGSRIREAQWWRTDSERKPVLPFVIVISSDPSLDPILSAELPPRPGMQPDCDPIDGKSGLVEAAGNRHLECPTSPLPSSSILSDPLRALYSGRVERGQSAVAALFDRTKDMIRYTYEGLGEQIDEKRVSDNKPKDGFDLVKGQLSNVNDVPFFHFRQCRLKGRKGPTMSWHDSEEAWEAMRVMTGLHGKNDPMGGDRSSENDADACGNAEEFFRLCVRLTMMVGVLDPKTNVRARPADWRDAQSAAYDDCSKRWPAPASR